MSLHQFLNSPRRPNNVFPFHWDTINYFVFPFTTHLPPSILFFHPPLSLHTRPVKCGSANLLERTSQQSTVCVHDLMRWEAITLSTMKRTRRASHRSFPEVLSAFWANLHKNTCLNIEDVQCINVYCVNCLVTVLEDGCFRSDVPIGKQRQLIKCCTLVSLSLAESLSAHVGRSDSIRLRVASHIASSIITSICTNINRVMHF